MSNARFPYRRGRHRAPVPGALALEIRDLCVAHRGAPELALSGVNLRVPVGARVALVGPNGAGKSTLLKAVAGLLPVRAGDIAIAGLPVRACHHRVAYLPQRSEVDWRFPMGVRQLVTSGRYVHLGWLRRPDAADRAIVEAVMARLQVADLAERQVGELSGGQQQRVLLARSLAQAADLLLLDEPLNAVDARTRAIVASVLAELGAEGKTIVAATHDLGRLAEDFDGVVYLEDGQETVSPSGVFAGTRYGDPTEAARWTA